MGGNVCDKDSCTFCCRSSTVIIFTCYQGKFQEDQFDDFPSGYRDIPGTIPVYVKVVGKIGAGNVTTSSFNGLSRRAAGWKKVSLSYSFGFFTLSFKEGHAVTLQILFLRGISWWWKVEKTFSSLLFWKHGAFNEFYGSFDISFQMRGAEFPVIHGLEKPKLLHTGTCKLTSTPHVTLKSPLLFQFPYCELCDNDNKQSNYRLMNVLFRT